MAELPKMEIATRAAAPRAVAFTNKVGMSINPALRLPTFIFRVNEGPLLSEAPQDPARTYAAADGTTWYLPRAVLARRSANSRVPDIRFDKRQSGTALRLVVDLVRNPAVAADARPLPIKDLTLHLVNSPLALTWTVEDQPPPPGVARRLRAEAPLEEAAVNALVTLMQTHAGAWFKLDGTVLYQSPGAAGPRPLPGPRPVPPILRVPRVAARPQVASVAGRFAARELNPAVLAAAAAAAVGGRPIVPRLQPQQASVRVQISTPQSTSAHFPTAVRSNQAIYAEVAGGLGADIDSHWLADANAGDLKEAPRFNQYYVLPDGFGLALDPDRGLPAVTALLVPGPDPGAAGTGAYRVRVRFGVAPRLDPSRMSLMRDLLRRQEGLAFADLAIGGYKAATFEAFRIMEQLGAAPGSVPPGAAAVAVDPRNGFDISLDLTVEQYALLASQLATSTGSLRGRVRFDLDAEDGATLNRDVDVSLRLDQPVEHPLVLGAPSSSKEDEPPDQVSVSNPSALPVTVSGATATLLVVEEGLPLEARPAAATPGGFTVEPGASVTLALTPAAEAAPEQPDGFVWNAVSLNLERIGVPFSPQDVLERVHELAATTKVPGRLRVWSWPLQQPGRLPPELDGKLFGLDVEVRRRSEDQPVTVTLAVGEADKQVDFGFTLADLVAGSAPGQSSFEVRRRNKLLSGPGPWTAWERQTGRELHADLAPS